MAWVVAGLGAARCVGREVGARPWSEPPSRSQTVADDGSRPLSPPAQLHGRAGGLCTVSEEPPRPPLPPGLLSLGASALCTPPLPCTTPSTMPPGVLGGAGPCHCGPGPAQLEPVALSLWHSTLEVQRPSRAARRAGSPEARGAVVADGTRGRGRWRCVFIGSAAAWNRRQQRA